MLFLLPASLLMGGRINRKLAHSGGDGNIYISWGIGFLLEWEMEIKYLSMPFETCKVENK